MFQHKSKLALAVAAAAGLTFSAGAYATNGILQAGNGMVAHGLGGAGIANAGEASAGMDNPALINDAGDSVSLAWNMFNPNREVQFVGSPAPDVSSSKLFAIPQVAFTSKIDNHMSWGLMAYALGGMNTDFTGTPGYNVSASGVDLSGLILSPVFSYAFNDKVSAGAALLIGYENLRMRDVFALAGPGTGISGEGAQTGYGAKLGVNWKVNDRIALGATFQPKIDMGEITFFCNAIKGGFGFTGDCALTLPTVFGVGGKFAVSKDVDIVADIQQAQWAGVDVFDFFGWDDQTIFKGGVEWRTSDKLALRAGVNYGKSPIDGSTPILGGMTNAAVGNMWFPAITESHATVGLTYMLGKNMALTGYYLRAFEKTVTGTAPTPFTLGAQPQLTMDQNAFGIGINYTMK